MSAITPRFLDPYPLAVEELDARHWRLLRALRYDSAVLGARLVIPVGFVTDFSSVPRIAFIWWLAGDKGRKAGTVHDFVYRHHLAKTRSVADAVYLEVLRVEHVREPLAQLMYAGVRLGGWTSW